MEGDGGTESSTSTWAVCNNHISTSILIILSTEVRELFVCSGGGSTA
jgi:hypothetical protein